MAIILHATVLNMQPKETVVHLEKDRERELVLSKQKKEILIGKRKDKCRLLHTLKSKDTLSSSSCSREIISDWPSFSSFTLIKILIFIQLIFLSHIFYSLSVSLSLSRFFPFLRKKGKEKLSSFSCWFFFYLLFLISSLLLLLLLSLCEVCSWRRKEPRLIPIIM